MRFSCTLQAGLVRGTKHPACGCTARTSSSIPIGVLNRAHCCAAGNPSARGGGGRGARWVTKHAKCGIIAALQGRTKSWYETPDLAVWNFTPNRAI